MGRTYSPISGEEVKRHSVTDVVDYILAREEGSRVYLYAPVSRAYGDRTLRRELELLQQKGYTRVLVDDEPQQIEDVLESDRESLEKVLNALETEEEMMVLVDRFVVRAEDEENNKRIADSVQTAFSEGDGEVIVSLEGGAWEAFNNRFELDGMTFLEPLPRPVQLQQPLRRLPHLRGLQPHDGDRRGQSDPEPEPVGLRRGP